MQGGDILRRRHLGLVLAAGALLALGGGALWQYRVELLTAAAIRALEQQDLGPVQLTVDEVGFRGFRAHGIALRGGAIEIGAVTAAYSPLGLVTAHLQRVEVSGLVAALAIGADGIEAGGQPLATGSGGGSPGSALDIDVIALPDVRLSLEGPAGKVEATVAATLALAGGELHGSDVTTRLEAAVAGARHAASVTAARVALEPRADGSLRVTVGQAAVTAEDLPWTAQEIDGELIWRPEQATAQLAVGRLVSRQQPAPLAPFALALTATLAGPRLDFALHVETTGKTKARLEAIGRHDRSSNSGSATLSLGPIVFHAGSLAPGDLLPALAGMAEDVEGSVALGGALRWRGAALSPDLTLRLQDLAFTAQGAQLRDLKGEIKVTGLWPPATPPGQVLTATVEGPGLPSAGLRVTGQLAAGPILRLERIALDVAGGEIATAPFAVDPAALEVATTLEVDHVDLAEITRLLSIDGLSGTGRLDGRIPIDVKGGQIAVSGGKLAAREPGVLSYRPGALPPEIAAAGDSVDLALRALGDFHYDALALELDKGAGGEGVVLLRLQGRNPAVMSGQAFNFNIRIESNFDRLAGYALLSLRSAQDLLRRAAGRDGR